MKKLRHCHPMYNVVNTFGGCRWKYADSRRHKLAYHHSSAYRCDDSPWLSISRIRSMVYIINRTGSSTDPKYKDRFYCASVIFGHIDLLYNLGDKDRAHGCYLWPHCVADADILFYRCDFFFFLSSYFLSYSQRLQIGCLSYFHTCCGLSSNLLGYRPEMCCTRLAENTWCNTCTPSHKFVGLYVPN